MTPVTSPSRFVERETWLPITGHQTVSRLIRHVHSDARDAMSVPLSVAAARSLTPTQPGISPRRLAKIPSGRRRRAPPVRDLRGITVASHVR
jgi:hypothetical protein